MCGERQATVHQVLQHVHEERAAAGAWTELDCVAGFAGTKMIMQTSMKDEVVQGACKPGWIDDSQVSFAEALDRVLRELQTPCTVVGEAEVAAGASVRIPVAGNYVSFGAAKVSTTHRIAHTRGVLWCMKCAAWSFGLRTKLLARRAGRARARAVLRQLCLICKWV